MDDLERYKRQILLPEIGLKGQQRLSEARALIVGLGGLGCPIALYLAAAGVGSLGLVDDDCVALSNLQRQILYTPDQIGQKKVEAAEQHLKNFNSEIKIQTFATRLTLLSARQIFRDFEIIIDGTDNFKTRYLISQACCELGQPHLYGGIFQFEGQVALFKGQPCYRCLFPTEPQAEEVPNCNQSGVVGALAGTIGSIQAMEAIKLIINQPRVSLETQLFVFDALNLQTRTLTVTARTDCPSCGSGNAQRLEPPEDPALPLQLTDKSLAPLGSIWLDVRNPDEVANNPVAGSKTLPLPELKAKLSQLDKNKTYVVFCQSGQRSLRAQQLLLENNFKKVWNLTGGLERNS
jgi:adenylyltransferase/sulfurtransferase